MCEVCLTLRNNTLESVQFGKCLNSTNIIQGLEIGLNGIFIKLFVIDEIYVPCKMLLTKGLKIYSLLPTNVFFFTRLLVCDDCISTKLLYFVICMNSSL